MRLTRGEDDVEVEEPFTAAVPPPPRTKGELVTRELLRTWLKDADVRLTGVSAAKFVLRAEDGMREGMPVLASESRLLTRSGDHPMDEEDEEEGVIPDVRLVLGVLSGLSLLIAGPGGGLSIRVVDWSVV